MSDNGWPFDDRPGVPVEPEKTPRHPAEDGLEFWRNEAARQKANLEKARAENQHLEQQFGKLLREQAAAVEKARAEEREQNEDAKLFAWLAKNPNCELSFAGMEDEAEWRVHRVTGGRNDREWNLLATGETPRDAISAAIIAAAIRARGQA